jgi:trimethylamine---corrinoid protein Co-methyltransferase
MQPKVSFLTQEMVEQILAEGMALLANPGVRIHNPDALLLLEEAGAQVDFEKEIACISEKLVLDALASAPTEFSLYDLTGSPAVCYGGDHVQFDPGSAAVTVLDSRTGEQRAPNTQDFVNFVRLVEGLPQLDAQSTAFVCQDVPAGMGDSYRLYLALSYMRKPIITGAFGKESWWVMLEMLKTAAGGAAELAAKPTAIFDVCPTPPLTWSDLTCQNLLDCARQDVPVQLVSMPLAGVSSPVVLASAVVQHTAESLSGVLLTQLAKPGARVVWGGAPAAVDMRTGATPMGDVNTWLIDSAYVQVGKYLNLPTHAYMGSSDAKILDAQCGFESGGGTFLAALAGVNMVSGAGMIDFLRCQSFEKLVIDAEVIGMAKRLLRGLEIPEGFSSVELMRSAAHKANFLSSPHTARSFSKELYLPSDIVDRGSLEAWKQKGQKTTQQRAAERAEKILKSPAPPVLSDVQRQELRQITAREALRLGMDNLPPLPED